MEELCPKLLVVREEGGEGELVGVVGVADDQDCPGVKDIGPLAVPVGRQVRLSHSHWSRSIKTVL